MLASLVADAATQAAPYQIRPLSIVVMIGVGAAIPLLTAFITKHNAHPALKGGITILLSALTALFTQAQVNDGVGVLSKQSVILWFFGLVTAEATYYAAWKQVNASANLAPKFGIGPANPPAA